MKRLFVVFLMIFIVFITACSQEKSAPSPPNLKTFEGTAQCARLKTGECQGTDVFQIDGYKIENRDMVNGINHGDKVRVTGIVREEIFLCKDQPCALVDGSTVKYVLIDTIEVMEKNRDLLKEEGGDCREHIECLSGVCDFIKHDFGKCAAVHCTLGSQAQGITDIAFFCDQNNNWQKIKNIGESCNVDYECFRRTGKDCPTCHPEDYRYYCKNNICVEEQQLNECEKQGLKRITSKEDADSNGDGPCFPLMAQRSERTVCAPCGDGFCNTTIESHCNCPEDCE